VRLDARAAAYGAGATATGSVTLPDTSRGSSEPVEFDLKGQARRIDLRRMPRTAQIPAAETNVNADYQVAGSVTMGSGSNRTRRQPSVVASGVNGNGAGAGQTKDSVVSGFSRTHPRRTTTNVKGNVRFLTSTLAGAEIAAGSTAAFAMNGDSVSYSADATVANLDLQRVGREFNVPALATDRYASTINGRVTAEGRGTDPRDMDVSANGTLTDTSVMGGRIPELTFDASLAQDTARLEANGTIADFDPAVASGKAEMKGSIGGRLDVDATVANVSQGVTPDSVQARAHVVLDPSTVGGVEITAAEVDAYYRDSTAEIRTVDVAGPDLNLRANGTLALTDDGQSNLQLHAGSPNLERIGKLVKQPLSGIVNVDATVAGNRRELQVTGTLNGSGLKHGENGALNVSSDFTAMVPDLRAVDASGSATTRATFVTVGGQNINELDATTSYDQKQLEFDATAREPQRSVTAAGTVVMHPEHQEIHLRNLGLISQGVQWRTADGAEAAIQYGKDEITVKDLRLVNGDQEITVDGTFGRPEDTLQVNVRNIDVATVDALMLREPQLAGRLNAMATISADPDAPSGSTRTPQVNAEFKIEQGGFRLFRYDTFGGTVKYRSQGITVDARLQQNPSTSLTANGYLPLALFKPGTAESRAAAHGAEINPEDRIDFHIDSSPIDAGLIQGFTTTLKDVTGTLQAKIDVSGSAADPHPEGAITIENVRFTVVPTNVNYTNLSGRIELQPDKVHIDGITILDDHQNPLNISGDLAVHERNVGSMQIYVNADDFKVIDNEMGDVRIYSSLGLSGELRAPRIEGDFGVTTGRINLDPILASVGDPAYATKPTEFESGVTDPDQKPAPSVMDALELDINLAVPNDLVVKATDLKAPGAPIGLGAMTVTLGGSVRARKEAGQRGQLVGAINTVRGFYEFQGRRFTILRGGAVRFEGLEEMDPALDIRAERVIQAVTARIRVGGTVRKPEIELSSVPPLEQADILALVVFNQPVNSLGEGQQVSLAQRAQALAIGSASGGLAKSVGNALNLSEFDINLTPEEGASPQVTLGQQVGQNLFVKVQQNVGDQSATNVILEYELTKWLRFRTNVYQGSNTQQQLFQRMQGSGADLLFFFSY
jgi:autotransporter translocation and assembly factor TamB